MLSANHDPAALHAPYLKNGRIHIPSILTEHAADTLSAAILAFEDWNRVLYQGGKHFDIYPAQLQAMTTAQHTDIRNAAYTAAQNGFSYLYDNYPLHDAYQAGTCPKGLLSDIYEFLNSPAFLDFVRTVTGHADIAFADAQLTRFAPGHFLTSHDDAVDGKNRRAAYVLNLTPRWRPDWGGLLQFFDQAGNVEGGFTPTFNALNMFSIPKPHAVSQVATFAGGARYSITGWLRAE
ncbi:proline hydroxylase [Kordiimonas sediminis]|uniref:Proline hydroxylase n=1 Tax=Kordiimonas sediminis TaxID=1735581 RepID=A0A919AMF2_9PROT|nr:2OG-Fe(II) oxygenase family protein [Kordiimonas sediminis]GHF14251.1 proline hydroxylase [Kordiimonas sediminis]